MDDEKRNDEIVVFVSDICKTFGPTKALDHMSLQVKKGQIVGLIGANGAGKTTLIKVLTGVHSPDSGTAIVCGEPIGRDSNPFASTQLGVHCAYQELTLCSNIKVYENFLLNSMSHEWKPKAAGWRKRGKKETKDILDIIFPDNDIDVSAGADTLSLMERQMVEICKAVSHSNLKVLILDEPTAFLSMERAAQLHAFLKELKKTNVAIIYISHKLNEIVEICDKVFVMKNGRRESEFNAENLTKETLVQALGGVVLPNNGPDKAKRENVERILSVSGLKAPNLKNINLVINKGEILGLTGLDGGGQSDLLKALFRQIGTKRIRGSEGLKVAYISGNRAKEGVFPGWTIAQNAGISVLDKAKVGFLISDRKLGDIVQYWSEKLKIKAPDKNSAISSLSGGNQQKVLIARGLASGADIILMNDPTCGVDIETKQEIYRIMADEKNEGKAIVLFSTEDSEMLQCDRAYIMHEGSIVEEIVGNEITENKIIEVVFKHKSAGLKASSQKERKKGPIGSLMSQFLQSRFIIALAAFAAIFGFSVYTRPVVATYRGFNMIYTSTMPWLFAAIAQMFISIGGGMDMGCGMAIGLVNVIAAKYMSDNPLLAFTMLFAVCCVYSIMGWFIYKTRIPSIVVTLGMSFVWQGLALIICPIPGGTCPAWLKVFSSFNIPVLPRPLVIGIVTALIAVWIVHYSSYGIVMNATGNNPMVAERAGWSTTRATMLLYFLAGSFVVISGLFLTALTGSGDYSGASMFPMTTIAIFILAGCEFKGAITSPVGVVIATFAMGGIASLLTFLNINSNFQTMVYGLVLVFAMIAKMIMQSVKGRTSK